MNIDAFFREQDYYTETHNGYTIVLRRNWSKAWCGYVGIDKHHPLAGKEYSDTVPHPDRGSLDISKLSPLAVFAEAFREDDGTVRLDCLFSVHGGLTYSSSGSSEYPQFILDDLWWFGFDCSHAGDLSPRDVVRQEPYSWKADGIYRDKDYTLAEARSLSDQLLAYAKEHLL